MYKNHPISIYRRNYFRKHLVNMRRRARWTIIIAISIATPFTIVAWRIVIDHFMGQ